MTGKLTTKISILYKGFDWYKLNLSDGYQQVCVEGSPTLVQCYSVDDTDKEQLKLLEPDKCEFFVEDEFGSKFKLSKLE